MGEYAQMALNGFLCAGCLRVLPDREEPGYPRYCKSCIPPDDDDEEDGRG